MHYLALVLGLTSPNSTWYLFWSGFGSDAAKIVLIAGLVRNFYQRERHHYEAMNRNHPR